MFYLIFRISKGLEIIDNEYEETLYRRSILLFIVYGVLTFLSTKGLQDQSNFLLEFLRLILSVAFSFFFGLIASFLLFKLGKLFGGEATFTETCVLYTYTLVPQMLLISIIWFLINTNYWSSTSISRNAIILLFTGISLKILLIGLVKLNKFSYLNGVAVLLIFATLVMSSIAFLFINWS